MNRKEQAEPTANLSCSPSRCEACGEEFTCGAESRGCWCMELRLSGSLLESLRGRYSSCLCRACLEGFAAEEKQITGL